MSAPGEPPAARRVEKENLAAFISKKREIFLVQMSLDIKTAEMKRLAESAKQVFPSHLHCLRHSAKFVGGL